MKNAINEAEQKRLWDVCKKECKDPAGKVTGFSAFCISNSTGKFDKTFSEFGVSLVTRAAEECAK